LAYQISTTYFNPLPIYYYFRFLKTNGRRIEILLPVSILTFHCHRRVILRWPSKFYANWMTADRAMTSYWFYKMAAIASQIYFRLLVWPCLTFKKTQSYWHTKFRPDDSIYGQDIITSDSSKQQATI